jgi:hypothetical protein
VTAHGEKKHVTVINRDIADLEEHQVCSSCFGLIFVTKNIF